MSGMEDLTDLMFEISNEDRLRILIQLDEETMNITGLSRRLGITTQEASRHLSRLSDVGLTQKEADGLHHTTNYGRLVLRQLRGLEFTSGRRDYFMTHSLESLPEEFVCRIGEIKDTTFIDDVMVAFYSIEKVIREAEEYLRIISDQYPVSSIPLFTDAFRRDVKVETIDAADWVPPQRLKDAIQAEDVEAVLQARSKKVMLERVLERLDVFLWMSEKEVAALAFPNLEGRFDYLGFTGLDPRFHRWCSDLFQHYWSRAEIKTEFVLIT